MAGKKQRFPSVKLREERDRKTGEPRKDEAGRSYWLARWTKNGARESEPIGWATDEEAEERRVAMEARLRLGMTPSAATSRSATVDDVIKRYLRDCAERGLAVRHVENEIDRLAPVGRALGHILAAELDDADLSRYVARRRQDGGRLVKGHRVGGGKRREDETPRRSTVRREVSVLVRAYRIARKLGAIECTEPRMPSFKGWPEDARPARRLTEGEVLALANAAAKERPELGRLVTFLAWCPRRPVASFALRRRDCARVLDTALPRRARQAFFARDKGGINRGWSPLTQAALEVLVEQLDATTGEPDDLVWQSETGRPLTSALVFYPLKRAAAVAGLDDVQLYDLRRFGAVRVQAHTGNLDVTCEYTGHRDVRTLLRYLSAPRGVAEEMAEQIGWTPAPLRLVDEDGEP